MLVSFLLLLLYIIWKFLLYNFSVEDDPLKEVETFNAFLCEINKWLIISFILQLLFTYISSNNISISLFEQQTIIRYLTLTINQPYTTIWMDKYQKKVFLHAQCLS
jgi:hypothetical protein